MSEKMTMRQMVAITEIDKMTPQEKADLLRDAKLYRELVFIQNDRAA